MKLYVGILYSTSAYYVYEYGFIKCEYSNIIGNAVVSRTYCEHPLFINHNKVTLTFCTPRSLLREHDSQQEHYMT